MFVAINCSNFHGELLESELFGYEKAARDARERLDSYKKLMN